MKNDNLKQYSNVLDELTDKEFRVFVYRFAFKLSYKEIAKRLKMSSKTIIKLVDGIKVDIEFAIMRKQLFKAFGLEDLL